MAPMPTDDRRLLESAIVKARDVAESAAHAALERLDIPAPDRRRRNAADRPTWLSPAELDLRLDLAARADLLGDGDFTAGTPLLAEEIAYTAWHRMLFARFLAEAGQLRHPSGASLSLADCADLADEDGSGDLWALAASFAAAMLPALFRPDDPAARVALAPEHTAALERLLESLPPSAFSSDDGIGWVYQFWQSARKKAVASSGRKIGGADISPVTQLFTEHYMVRFLLENSLGAWWAARHPDSPLLADWSFLRFLDDGSPAAGTFPSWPATAAEVTVIDPCCGSGHFLIEAFERLVPLRMRDEGLSAAAAVDAVLRDNIFGLELDARCVEIAAFALALAARQGPSRRSAPRGCARCRRPAP